MASDDRDELDKAGIRNRYAGPDSVKFWKIINSLPEPQQSTAYSLGIVLQNMEGEIRRLIGIEIAEARGAGGSKARVKDESAGRHARKKTRGGGER